MVTRKPKSVDKEDSRLSTELEFYAAHKQEWLDKHSGKFVVVQQVTVLGFYDSFEIAFKDAVRALGLREDFLVKQVFAVEPVYFIYQLFA